MKGRQLAILLLIALFAAVALIFYIGVTGGSHHQPGTRSDQTAVSAAPTVGAPTTADATVEADRRRQRDELRKRILEAWSKGETIPEGAADAKEGRFVPHPNADGYGIEPKYIQAAFREQMFPMVSKCYEDLLVRAPDAGGRIQLWFKIVGDDKLGGIVEEDENADGGHGSLEGGFGDEKMKTCVRESLLTVTFPPPAKDGVVTVGYPIILSPNDEADGGK